MDDFAIFAKHRCYMDCVLNKISSKFEFKDLGPISNFLGVQFENVNGNLVMHQKNYIRKMQERYCNIPVYKVKIPMNPGIVIYNLKEHEIPAKNVPYRNLIGSLLFLANRSRPDIMFSIIVLSQFSSNPSESHWKMLCQVYNYVIQTMDYCINLSSCKISQLNAYSDASWASDRDSRKSMSGFIIYLGDVPVSWKTLKQKCVALSSMEAEFVALSETVKEVIWLFRILSSCQKLKLKFLLPNVYCDNQSAMHFSKNFNETQRSKHIDTRFFFVKQLLSEGKFELLHVSGKRNVADLLTKSLSFEKFKIYCNSFFL